MKTAGDSNPFGLPPALLTALEAAAADVHRPANEIVREALEGYLAELHSHPHGTPDAQSRSATVARMLERRRGRHLSPGVTIEDVIAWGREGRA
jgi:hypothetical protein